MELVQGDNRMGPFSSHSPGKKKENFFFVDFRSVFAQFPSANLRQTHHLDAFHNDGHPSSTEKTSWFFSRLKKSVTRIRIGKVTVLETLEACKGAVLDGNSRY